MRNLQWVDVNKVGGVKNWGDRINLAVGAKVDKPYLNANGRVELREETVTEIQRLDNGAHVVITSGIIP